jgi:chromate transporter
MTELQAPNPAAATPAPASLARLVGYFAYLGSVGFGGPIALAGRMRNDLVERRRWFSSEEYLDGLALAQLAPGPLAAQLAMYLGYLRGRSLGATIVGTAFIAPSFLMVVGIASAYVNYSGLHWVQAMFYGIGPAAIAVMVCAASRLTRSVLGRDPLLWLIFLSLLATTVLCEREYVWLFLGSGVLTVALRGDILTRNIGGSASAMVPLAWPSAGPSLSLFLFFAKASLFVFGSGLAIVPFLYAGVVQEHRWLNDREFMDAVAVAMITPGPVVIMVAFIGYLVAGWTGASLAALGVFLPTYLVVIFLAPVYHRYARVEMVRHFVAGVTSAAAGALAGATLVLAGRSIIDLPTIFIAIFAFLALKLKSPEALVVLGAGVLAWCLQAVSPQKLQTTKDSGPCEVVFVCEHGAALSVISATYFNKFAKEENLNYHAVARGVTPQEKVSAQAATGLKRDGLAPEIETPLALSRDDLNQAACVVTFFPIPVKYSTKSPAENWRDVTWAPGSYEKSRDGILMHMQDLVRKLRAETKPR